ncbi:cyclic pyranopterin monophosphate synthase MoaC [Seleniivibrio sp.]|uniref:cyclic pyranopterin monophosphate synthase MoaC n=1 Tax=Seleniivibrio sp. TaxID=2898801 RepID=UPI0025F11626|nr:cyclic pyranopterin monophosphate synthase MoaC [Seleniivibrio sp.]MCD8554055.1 cyclic pyranopterin monophosphate synthase MoaC [Seleniivibrio sp.]
MELTHFDEEGRSRMVDVTDKGETVREAIAAGFIKMKPETMDMLIEGKMAKGRNVFEVARVAAIMGVKRTSDLIPMCHPLFITKVDVYFEPDREKSQVDIEVVVKMAGKTGVEMEALTGVSVAALTLYDMCKAVDKDMLIGGIRVMKKTGGKSGTYIRQE